MTHKPKPQAQNEDLIEALKMAFKVSSDTDLATKLGLAGGTISGLRNARHSLGVAIQCAVLDRIAHNSYVGRARELESFNEIVLAWHKRKKQSNARFQRKEKPIETPAANAAGAEKKTCDTCSTPVSERVVDFCIGKVIRFGGKVLCMNCQKAHGQASSPG